MALSPMYAAILQDLNKAVSISQPEDVLQFCANWFNAKLEEQRIAGRANLVQSGGAVSAGSRSKSLSANSPNASTTTTNANINNGGMGGAAPNPMRKKASLPSLVGAGYSFGSSGKTPPRGGGGSNGSGGGEYSMISEMDMGAPSPYSEVPPPSSMGGRIPPMPSLRASASASSLGNNSSATSGGPISWNRSFAGAAGTSRDRDAMHDSDEENYGSSDAPPSSFPGSSSRSEGRDRLGALPSSLSNRENNNNNSGMNGNGGSGIPPSYNLGRRTSVSAESIDPNSLSSQHPMPKVIIPKTPSQKARIEGSIEKNLLFRNLDEEQHVDVLNAMKEVRVAHGTEVIVQGAVGDFFYVVEQGEFRVWVRPQSASGMLASPPPSTSAASAAARARSLSPGAATGDPEGRDDGTITNEDGSTSRADGAKLVATIQSGGSFGELALMYNAPRAATVVCSSPSATLWALDRVTFRTILMEHTFKKRKLYEKFLAEVPILLSLETYERSKIADALEERIYEEGEDVVREGELGKNFYIIESGRAEVLKKKGDKSERVGTLSKGDYFGELALLNSAPRAATVRPLPGSGRLRVATLGEKAFTRLLGPVVEILTRRAERNYGATAGPSSSSAATTPTAASSAREREREQRKEAGERERERESGIPLSGAGSKRAGGHRTGTPGRRYRDERERDREDVDMAD